MMTEGGHSCCRKLKGRRRPGQGHGTIKLLGRPLICRGSRCGCEVCNSYMCMELRPGPSLPVDQELAGLILDLRVVLVPIPRNLGFGLMERLGLVLVLAVLLALALACVMDRGWRRPEQSKRGGQAAQHVSVSPLALDTRRVPIARGDAAPPPSPPAGRSVWLPWGVERDLGIRRRRQGGQFRTTLEGPAVRLAGGAGGGGGGGGRRGGGRRKKSETSVVRCPCCSHLLASQHRRDVFPRPASFPQPPAITDRACLGPST